MQNDIINKLETLCSELNGLIESKVYEESKTKRAELDQQFAQLMQEAKNATLTKEESEAISKINKQYNKLSKTFSSGLFQIYQTRDLERWEHYSLKLKICEELNRINSCSDEELAKSAVRFKQLREQWQSLGSVPHEKADEQWSEFRKVCNSIHKRMHSTFTQLDKKRASIDEAKKAIIEQVKTLSQEPNFQQVTPKIKELQQQWKNLGMGHMKVDRQLYAEFKTLCDSFFVARNEFFNDRKSYIHDATAQKVELIDEAIEFAKNPTDNPRRMATQLYAKWRELPYAGKNDQKLYNKFKKAVDSIFEAQEQSFVEAANQKMNWCNEVKELTEKLSTSAINLTQASEAYTALQKSFKQLPDSGNVLLHEINTAKKSATLNMEKLLTNLRCADLMAGVSGRKELEMILAEQLSCIEANLAEDILAKYQTTAGKQAVTDLRQLAQRPLDYRLRKLEEFSKQRRFIIKSIEQSSGSSDLSGDVELLALALESAIRDNFGSAAPKKTSIEELEKSFMAIPLAKTSEIDELFNSFEAAVANAEKGEN